MVEPYLGLLGAIGLMAFAFLPLKVRMLFAFIVMTRGFDLVPPIVGGIDVWDCGAVIFFLSALPLLFSKAPKVRNSDLYLTVFKVFYAWLLLCFVWSLVGYQYPWLNTIKVSRQMIIGYLSLFVMIRLFMVDQTSLQFFMRWLYVITFVLMPVSIVQTLLKIQIMFNLSQAYGSLTRSIPIFLSITLFYLYGILSRLISGQRIKLHEGIYSLLVLIVVALTYTRGIYLAFSAVCLLLVFNLACDRRLNLLRMTALFVVATLCLPLLVYSGYLDNVIDRFSNGIDLVMAKKVLDSKRNVDSFKGRIALTEERFGLVWEQNPVVGFGFLHEDDVPTSMRNSFKSGSVITTPEYLKRYRYNPRYTLALYSADIGWANLVLMTGFVGLAVFTLFLGCFFLSYYRRAEIPAPFYHHRHAFFLQTIMMAVLMFNGDTFVSKLQVACFMIAGYTVTSYRGKLESELSTEGMKPA